VGLAGPGRDLAATLPASALTAGIALGSTIAGWGISAYGPSAPVLIAAVTCLAVLPLFWATTFLRPPAATRTATDTVPQAARSGDAPEPAAAEQQ
jgi:DHA1 family inner membrane transport protein